MQLLGKKAFILGGTRGIGRAIAEAYAAEGAAVAIAARKEEHAEKAASELRACGAAAYGLGWDVSEVGRADERMARAAELLGGLDIVVVNSGVIEREPFLSVSEKSWDEVMNVNLKGAYFACQAAANWMIGHGVRGKIVVMGSETGFQPAATPYAISKWGVAGFAIGMARRLYRKGVSLSVIAPGPIATDMMLWSEGKPKDFPNAFSTLGEAKDVAALAVFLATERGMRIAGRPVFLSGGLDW